MAQKLLRDTTCGFCRENLSDAPEHVLKDAFIKRFFPHKDERGEDEKYSFEIGGRPVLNRYGSKWTQNNFPRVMFPCCKECNGTLNTRFEQPAEEIILLLFSDGSTDLDSNGMHRAGLWLLKTCLLLVHPEARQKARDYIPLPQWNLTTIPDMYSWMVNDHPPPVGLSVWVSQVRDPEPGDPPSQQIMLPTVVVDGRSTQFQGNQCAIRFLGIDLVYHPGWAIEHPLEADGRAVRMWPYSGSSSTVSITGLPAVSSRAIAWITGPEVRFAPGMYEEGSLGAVMELLKRTHQHLPWSQA